MNQEKITELRLTIAIDDVNPKKGYRILGDQTEGWLRQLNEQFGCRFTLFIPANYHGQYPLTKHKEWVKELNSIEWIEFAAHGYLHQCNDSRQYGECEMFEPNYFSTSNIDKMLGEWYETTGVYPIGWRSPGWLINEENKRLIERIFEYVAIHYEHNRGMQWDCKTFYGHDGIQQENISIHNDDMIMFQSHIYGNHNHNVWNEHNYEQLRLSLSHLFENYTITPKLLKECL